MYILILETEFSNTAFSMYREHNHGSTVTESRRETMSSDFRSH